jgi:hypothetical protein
MQQVGVRVLWCMPIMHSVWWMVAISPSTRSKAAVSVGAEGGTCCKRSLEEKKEKENVQEDGKARARSMAMRCADNVVCAAVRGMVTWCMR